MWSLNSILHCRWCLNHYRTLYVVAKPLSYIACGLLTTILHCMWSLNHYLTLYMVFKPLPYIVCGFYTNISHGMRSLNHYLTLYVFKTNIFYFSGLIVLVVVFAVILIFLHHSGRLSKVQEPVATGFNSIRQAFKRAPAYNVS